MTKATHEADLNRNPTLPFSCALGPFTSLNLSLLTWQTEISVTPLSVRIQSKTQITLYFLVEKAFMKGSRIFHNSWKGWTNRWGSHIEDLSHIPIAGISLGSAHWLIQPAGMEQVNLRKLIRRCFKPLVCKSACNYGWKIMASHSPLSKSLISICLH